MDEPSELTYIQKWITHGRYDRPAAGAIYLSTWKAAENARHFRLLEVARDGLVGCLSLGELNRAGEAVDLGPARRRLALRRRLRASTLGGGLDEHCLCRAHLCTLQEAPRRGAGPR